MLLRLYITLVAVVVIFGLNGTTAPKSIGPKTFVNLGEHHARLTTGKKNHRVQLIQAHKAPKSRLYLSHI